MALTKNRQYLGHRWVEVYAAKKEVSLVCRRRAAERHVRPMAAEQQLGCTCSKIGAFGWQAAMPQVCRLATQRLQLLGTICTRQGLALALKEQQTHTLSVRLATADAECHAYMLPLECCRAVAKHTMSLNV